MTTVSSGQTLDIFAGQTSKGVIVLNGGALVLSGGTASGTIVSSGGTEQVYSGGTAIGTMVSSGGLEVVSSGGVASATTISNGGFEYIFSGGKAIGTVVSSGGKEFVYGTIASSRRRSARVMFTIIPALMKRAWTASVDLGIVRMNQTTSNPHGKLTRRGNGRKGPLRNPVHHH
jgi:autotransporter passenger strand-loop-strand repeat protein